MMLQFVASPMIVILMTLEAPMIIILTTLENVYRKGVTYDCPLIVIVQATDYFVEALSTTELTVL